MVTQQIRQTQIIRNSEASEEYPNPKDEIARHTRFGDIEESKYQQADSMEDKMTKYVERRKEPRETYTSMGLTTALVLYISTAVIVVSIILLTLK